MTPTRSTADVFARSLAAPPATTSASADATAASASAGGFLVCLDVPPGTEFGIDYEVFRTGPLFRGVKFVPLGLHLVVFRSRDHEHGIRQGLFLRVERPMQVLVREWSSEREELGPPRPGLNIEHLERAVLSFQLDGGLGPYPAQHHRTWRRLSRFVSPTVLERCGVTLGAILLPGDTTGEDPNTDGGVVPYFPDQPRTVRFTRIRYRPTESMSAAERTQYHLDRSALLLELLKASYENAWEELLGEFQLAFIVFLQLSSLAALEQWKQMTSILCSCERALATHTELFVAFTKVLRTQLEQIPTEFFEEELTEQNFLRPCLQSFLELVLDDEVSVQLREQGRRLEQLLTGRFQVMSTAEHQSEDAPVLVAPDEIGRLQASSSSANEDDVDDNAAIALAFLEHRRRRRERG